MALLVSVEMLVPQGRIVAIQIVINVDFSIFFQAQSEFTGASKNFSWIVKSLAPSQFWVSQDPIGETLCVSVSLSSQACAIAPTTRRIKIHIDCMTN